MIKTFKEGFFISAKSWFSILSYWIFITLFIFIIFLPLAASIESYLSNSSIGEDSEANPAIYTYVILDLYTILKQESIQNTAINYLALGLIFLTTVLFTGGIISGYYRNFNNDSCKAPFLMSDSLRYFPVILAIALVGSLLLICLGFIVEQIRIFIGAMVWYGTGSEAGIYWGSHVLIHILYYFCYFLLIVYLQTARIVAIHSYRNDTRIPFTVRVLSVSKEAYYFMSDNSRRLFSLYFLFSVLGVILYIIDNVVLMGYLPFLKSWSLFLWTLLFSFIYIFFKYWTYASLTRLYLDNKK
ncbi:MAG: hypothetical protein JW737_07215 [Acidobacteria bacterium]|nr:hypothetical protein [Acidobacteriota bacterium]